MSGFLAVSGLSTVPGGASLRRSLAPLARLGGDEVETWRGDGSLVVVTRKSWQLDDGFCGRVLVLEDGDLVVAADASLYNRRELAAGLGIADRPPAQTTPSHLLAAGYRAWGPDVVTHLNGDFAFVILDRRRGTVYAARDRMGSRPLYWARLDDGIAFSSSSRVLAELTGRTGDLNLAALGSQVAGLIWSAGIDTAYRGVEVLPAAHRATWETGAPRCERYWSPAPAPSRRPVPLREAAEELRGLLEDAVTARMGEGTTTVWMSGGWDSTAVFAAGQKRLHESGDGHRLRPICIGYPEGDPGNEDELIRMVADRWDADIDWLPSADIPLYDDLVRRSADSDEPPAHMYELWNRALARRTRASGARVALDGNGGDQAFAVSDVVLAHHLRTGSLPSLVRHARAKAGHGRRYLARYGLLPLLPSGLLRLAERISRRRLPRHYLERPSAAWVREEFMDRWNLRERDIDAVRAPISSPAQAESVALLTMPLVAWNFGYMRGALLQEGVEARSPLLDPAVLDFALSRPVRERAHERETKILLRSAMSGLLPQRFLAPRRYRTGTTVGFSHQRMRESYPGLLDRLFAEPLLVAELGIVDAARLREASENWLGDDWVRVNLFNTMRVEFWLRGMERDVTSRGRPPQADQLAVAV